MKVAIVSGAASGIAQQLCRQYAMDGIAVVAGYYPADPHDPEVTAKLVRDAGGKCVMAPLDVRSTEQCEEFAALAIREFGRLDIAVAAAGLIRGGPLESVTDADWNLMLDVNLSGVMRTLRAASRVIQDGGSMVAVSSFLGANLGWQNYSAYSAAKAGIVGFCRSVAVELAPRRIRVNTVIPGIIETPQTLDSVNSIGIEGLQKMGRIIPFKRVGQAHEVASTIRHLTSDDASYITGQEICCDGGMTVAWSGGL